VTGFWLKWRMVAWLGGVVGDPSGLNAKGRAGSLLRAEVPVHWHCAQGSVQETGADVGFLLVKGKKKSCTAGL
jgi:predicted DNA repair protein MutK